MVGRRNCHLITRKDFAKSSIAQGHLVESIGKGGCHPVVNGLGKTQGPAVSELNTMRCLLRSPDGGGEKWHKRLQHAFSWGLDPTI